MKFAVAKEHRDFFQRNGWIEFEDFLSQEQVTLVNQEVDAILEERCESPNKLGQISPDQLFLKGHDLWRSSPAMRKFTTLPRFGEIASELIEKKPLRLGCDQLYPSFQPTRFSQSNVYGSFLEKTASLESVCCLTELACGVVFSLGGQHPLAEEPQRAIEKDIFPTQAGHTIFFLPSLEIPWNALSFHPGQRYYLIVYTYLASHYILQSGDPHTHLLKQLGYIFNDKLNDRLHPVVYR